MREGRAILHYSPSKNNFSLAKLVGLKSTNTTELFRIYTLQYDEIFGIYMLLTKNIQSEYTAVLNGCQ